MRLLLALFFCVFLQACGYRLGFDGLPQRYSTITVPYIVGDWDGQMTSALIQQISLSGSFQYKETGGDLILNVLVLDFRDENIGFRYDRDKEGRLTRSIIPTETRAYVVAEVSLRESCSSATVLGPVRITAYVDFDHDYYSSRDEINVFSLGQLNDYDAALDDVQRPLSKTLAQKIVDFISNSW